MKIYLKIYLGLLLITCVSFGLITVFIFDSPIAGLFGGISFALLIISIVSILYLISSKKSAVIHKKKVLILEHSYDEVVSLCLASLNLIKAKIEKGDKHSSSIVATTAITWKSFGEIIQFNIQEIDSKKTQVRISSQPLLPTTFVDHGKNLENIEKISDFLIKG